MRVSPYDRSPEAPSHLERGRRHRPEIDGLRAVAVLGVLVFHAGLGIPGGYVGVDVFFVLSGFLITTSARRALRDDRFSLALFWERRARRILPALVVVSLVVLAAGWVLLLPADYAALGRSVAAQATLVANLHFARSAADYFATTAGEQPLLHTWSLAVEAQFYLVAPLLLLLLFRLRASPRPAAAPLLLGILVLASFAWSVVAVVRAPASAFYLLPARAWELLLGVALALVPTRWPGARRATREVAAWAGLVLVVVPALVYRGSTPFPGLAALPPCAGTLLLLWSNAVAPTTAGALLSVRPLVFVGRISYSLYLWHWPLLAFARDDALAPLSIAVRSALLAASFALAALSWRWVETPLRERRALVSVRSFATATAAALTAISAGGALVARSDGVPGRFPARALDVLEAKADRAFLRDVSLDDARAGDLVPLGIEDPGAVPRLLVWGDSHAMAVLPAFDALLAERGQSGVAATHVATPPVLDFVWGARGRFGLGEEAPPWAEAVVARAREARVRDVVLVANWRGYVGADREQAPELETALLATVARLAQSGLRPAVLLQIPWQGFDVPEAMARAVARERDLSAVWSRPSASNGIADVDPQLARRIVAAGGRVLDPRPGFLDAAGERYVGVSAGVVLYADAHHLTARGARLVLLPLLREAFPAPAPGMHELGTGDAPSPPSGGAGERPPS